MVFSRFRPTYMFPFPASICLEASTRCNLRCLSCSTGKGRKGMSKGFLKFSDFKKFIDKYYFIERILLSNYGEIFLNPEIFEIIKYAENRGIKTNADTNLNDFDEPMAEKLVKAGMSSLTVSLDGASQESYAKYRRGGNFDRVIFHIEAINRFKKKYQTDKPDLTWQFVVFDHNRREIDKAREMAVKLKMSFRTKSNWDQEFSPVQDRPDFTGNFCHQLWHMPVINYNGNMLGCCTLFEEKYHLGNVFKEGFFQVYNGQKMRTARKVILKKIKGADNIYCSECRARRKCR